MGANDLLWNTSNISEEFDDAEEDSQDEKQGSIDGHVRLKKVKPAIQFLFERLSAILRRETLRLAHHR
jgi:hypothetical protein